jgi:hypothetical protein
MLALHREVQRAPYELQQQPDSRAVVLTAGADEKSRARIDWLEHERPGNAVQAGITGQDKRALRLDLGDEEAVACPRRPRHQVADLNLLQFGTNSVGASEAAVVEAVVAVPAAAAAAQLHQPGPDRARRRLD